MLTAAALVAGSGGRALAASAREYTPAAVVTALVDRMLPAVGPHPGALATGVEESVLADLTSLRGGEFTRQLTEEMHAIRFLDLEPDARDAAIQRLLRDPGGAVVARVMRYVLDRAVSHYLSTPASWSAFAYHQPQPHGYPEFVGCPGRDPA